MITISNYSLRKNKEGKDFISLELKGDVELIQSMQTGRFYATARKCFITSTFDEPTAKALIGKQMPGTIQRVESEPYEYTVPETSEVIVLQHTYSYVPDESYDPPAAVRQLQAV